MKSGDGKKLNRISWIECQDGMEMRKTNILIQIKSNHLFQTAAKCQNTYFETNNFLANGFKVFDPLT